MGGVLSGRAALWVSVSLLGGIVYAAEPAPSPSPAPLNPGLTERAESRLIQFEVRISRKGVPVPGITAKDLDIELGGKPLKGFSVDDMCTSQATPAAPAVRPGSFIFYFDDPELTVEGRNRSIEVARLVTSALLTRGHDLLILRNGAALTSETKWTHDPAEVNAALDRIAKDPGNNDYLRAGVTEAKVEKLLDQARATVRDTELNRNQSWDDAWSSFYNDNKPIDGGGPKSMIASTTPRSPGGTPGAGMMVKMRDSVTFNAFGDMTIRSLVGELDNVVQQELQRTGRDLERLRAALRSLSSRDAPKGLVYFADTMRSDPGAVVHDALGSTPEFTNRNRADRNRSVGTRDLSTVATWNADGVLQDLVTDAAAYGARFYAVEGRGLANPSDWVRSSQDTLTSIALQTGGMAFVNGLAGSRIAESIAADQACWYLVSFSPRGWDTDRTLGVGVYGKKSGLHIDTRPTVVIPSSTALTHARLLAAHFGDPASESPLLPVSIYPIGGTSKRFQALAQVELPSGPQPEGRDATWDVGFDVVSKGSVVAHTAGRVAWRGAGHAPLYQATLSIPSGPYEIVAVAQEVGGDAVREGRIHGSWPAASAEQVTLSRPALAQPVRRSLVVDGESRSSGIVVRGYGTLVDPRQPVALVTAACVEGPKDLVLRAERTLIGENEVPFKAMDLVPDEGRCVQIRDLVAANSLSAGRITYFVRILSGDREVAAQELSFDVAEIPSPAPASQPN